MKWRHRSAGVALILAFIVSALRADDYPRQTAIDILHYTFALELSDESDAIRGRATMQVKFNKTGVDSFTLDLIGRNDAGVAETGMIVRAVTNGADPVEFTHEGDRLSLHPDAAPAAGEVRSYTIDYEGVPADGLIIGTNRHGDRTFFADNFPNRARHWLPTLDHPSDKAACEFIITAPEHYRVIATGTLIDESEQPGGLRRTQTRQDTPLSTYLMVIGVARFAVQDLQAHHGIPLSTWVYPQDREAGFRDFSEAGAPLDFFIDYIGPYPWSKLANVQSTTRYGGMENAGNIFYGERAITGRGNAGPLIAHEIAHQWFGDAVTVDDWHHVWLSEGFATYFTHLYHEHAFGRERLADGLQRDRQRVIGYAQRNPDQPIIDPRIPVERILSANVYQKAGWVLHMLRREIGDEAFHTAIRRFFERYRHDNAVTADFQAVVEEVAGRDLDVFFEQWFHKPGVPEFEGEWTYDADARQVIVTMRQVRAVGTIYDLPLDIGIIRPEDSFSRAETVRINAAEHRFTFECTRAPDDVVLDPDTWLLFEAQFGRK